MMMMMMMKKQTISYQNENQAPYHIISQCFYVYVLLEGGQSVKKQDATEEDDSSAKLFVSHGRGSHMYSVLCLPSHNPRQISSRQINLFGAE